MKRSLKTIAILFATVCVLMIMAVPAFADTSVTYYSNNLGYYTQGSASTYSTANAVTVTLDIQSRKISGNVINKQFTVSFPAVSTARTISVTDVLVKAMTDNTGLYFQNSSGNNLVTGSSYLYQVVYGGTTYSPTGSGYNGWMFKINSKFTLLSGTPGSDAKGAAINQAYVQNGDKITVYMDDASSSSSSTLYTRIKSASYSSGVLTFTTQYNINYYSGSNYIWNIPNYTGIYGVTVGIYSNVNDTTPIASVTTTSSTASISASLTSGSTYYIKINPTYYSNGNLYSSGGKEAITIS